MWVWRLPPYRLCRKTSIFRVVTCNLRPYAPLKCHHILTRVRGVTLQKTEIVTFWRLCLTLCKSRFFQNLLPNCNWQRMSLRYHTVSMEAWIFTFFHTWKSCVINAAIWWIKAEIYKISWRQNPDYGGGVSQWNTGIVQDLTLVSAREFSHRQTLKT
jgi:hypothetical protein